MSREKELVNELRQWIDFLKVKEPAILIDEETKKVVARALKTYEKLLSLPTRTLETLEVGDYVEVEFTDVAEFEETAAKGLVIYVNLKRKWLGIGGDEWLEIDFDDVADIYIIPHEALELLKGVVGNE